MEDRLAPLSAARPWAKSPGRLVADLDALYALRVELEATWLAHIRELEGRGIPQRDGATSAQVWLRNRYRIGLPSAHRLVKLAAAVDSAPEPVRDAVADHSMNLDQADVIIRSLTELPADVGRETRDLAAKELVRLAGELDPANLAHAGKAILHHVAPETADEADRKALERAEARALATRGFTMTPDPTGCGIRISGSLTNESASVIRAAIEPLCTPGAARHREPFPSAPDTGSAAQGGNEPFTSPADARPAAQRGNEPFTSPSDTRTAAQRRADALVELCRLALNTTELPANGGDRPQVVVNIPYDILKRELGPGTLDNGDRITPESARRIACDCRLLPIVFNGVGQPLDAGRTRRLVPAPLRRALVTRDHGCTFPGCDRSPRWTDAHHVVPWSAGGPTSLENLALLCQFHHTEVHKPGGWTMYMATDHFPTFIPPPHIDPNQSPRRNTYHRRL